MWRISQARIDLNPLVSVTCSLGRTEITVNGNHSFSRRISLVYSNQQSNLPTTFRRLFVQQSSGFPSPNPIDLTNLTFIDGTQGSLFQIKGLVLAARWPDNVIEARAYFTGRPDVVSDGYDGFWDLGVQRYYFTPQSPVVVLAGWLGGGISSSKRRIRFDTLFGGVPSTLLVIWGD